MVLAAPFFFNPFAISSLVGMSSIFGRLFLVVSDDFAPPSNGRGRKDDTRSHLSTTALGGRKVDVGGEGRVGAGGEIAGETI